MSMTVKFEPTQVTGPEAFARLAFSVVADLAYAALLMFALGALHDGYPAVVAFGYWSCFLILLGVSAVRNTVRTAGKWWEK